MENSQNDRRLKIALVNPRLLLDFLTTSNVTGVRYAKIASEPLVPDGAKVIHVSYDMNRMCLAVVLCHESFDVVPPGMIIPTIADWELEYTIVRVQSEFVDLPAESRVALLEETLDGISKELPIVIYGGEASGKQESIAKIEFLLESYELSKSQAKVGPEPDHRKLAGKCMNCDVDLFDSDFFEDKEGWPFCWKCFSAMSKDVDDEDWPIDERLVLNREILIETLKDMHREYGIDVMFSIRSIAKKLGCRTVDLFNKDEDTGVLYELWKDGTVRGDFEDWALMGNWEWSE